ncbi:Uncharacterized protein ALO43_03495 [Pseudomonas tremae]|uniref:Uncharacterized protein n=1 Tax=Pseudomonas tremae TaxID=200454 RepID=A0AA40P0C7_9PSED|nr:MULTISPECIES: hypothetical protein [Pseudomonas syringae group]KPY92117.1 Uncharacterized protein ALO43_03495 [Pseudomonas tremae]RMO03081.1 hypothetical protein ALQ48_04099 [Pseudomonas coronafaciens pv. zizaniae]
MMINNSDLAEMLPSALTGVTVGVGAQVLLFGDVASVMIQCSFFCEINGVGRWGHGEDVATSPLFFDFLNVDVERISIDEFAILTVAFNRGMILKIFPENNGLESYVINTPSDIFPVILW